MKRRARIAFTLIAGVPACLFGLVVLFFMFCMALVPWEMGSLPGGLWTAFGGLAALIVAAVILFRWAFQYDVIAPGFRVIPDPSGEKNPRSDDPKH